MNNTIMETIPQHSTCSRNPENYKCLLFVVLEFWVVATYTSAYAVAVSFFFFGTSATVDADALQNKQLTLILQVQALKFFARPKSVPCNHHGNLPCKDKYTLGHGIVEQGSLFISPSPFDSQLTASIHLGKPQMEACKKFKLENLQDRMR